MRKQKKPFQEKNAVKCGYDPRNTNDPTSPADDKCLFKWQDYVKQSYYTIGRTAV